VRQVNVRCARCGGPAIGKGKVDGQGYCVEHALGIVLVALNAKVMEELNGEQ
jgi:hypothetical protein